MSYLGIRLGSVAPCCGLLELAMNATEMKRWLASVARLTTAQKAEFLNALRLMSLSPLPMDWAEQRKVLGLG